MANLKEIRNRINSVNSTKQVTSAMKLVSAAKLRKAQEAIVQFRPYAEKLHKILTNICSQSDVARDNVFSQQRDLERVLIIAITSNRGLCGAFNANVIKKAVITAKEEYGSLLARGRLDFLTIGRKAGEVLKSQGYNIVESHNELLNQAVFANVKVLAESVMERFVNGTYDKVEIIYNQFKNAGVQILKCEQFLPVEVQEDKKPKMNQNYIYEPDLEFIVNEMIPRSLKTQLYKTILDSIASEHGARMTAMHIATDNAFELLKQLKLNYNKARQASITNEILEIVSGAEALKG